MSRIISAILLCLLGIARGIGGVTLIMNGPQSVDTARVSVATSRALGLGLLLVSLLAVVAAFGIHKKSLWATRLAIAAPLVFVADGMLNGILLFGKPGAGGTIANAVAAGVIIGFVWLAKRRGELSRPA